MTREATGSDRPIRVAIRLDDFSNGSPDALDRFIVETIVSAGLAITVAAVPLGDGPDESRAGPAGDPRPLRGAKADILRPHLAVGPGVTGGRVELAQHGLDHQPVGRDSRGRPTELAGLPFRDQLDRIGRGLEILEREAGLRPRTFVPPWNRYDEATLVALHGLEFTVLSAGRDAPPGGSDLPEAADLALIPATLGWTELERAMDEARRAEAGRTLIPLLHPYDFDELQTPWSRLGREAWAESVRWLAAQPDVRCLTLSELAQSGDMGTRRLAAYARFHASPIRRMVPESTQGSLERPLMFYADRNEAESLALRRAGTALLIHTVIAVVAGGLGWALGRALPTGGADSAFRWFAVAAVVLLGWRAFRGDGPYFRGLAATLAGAALAAGAWLS